MVTASGNSARGVILYLKRVLVRVVWHLVTRGKVMLLLYNMAGACPYGFQYLVVVCQRRWP